MRAPFGEKPIQRLRLAVQLLSFVAIFYTGYLVARPERPADRVPPPGEGATGPAGVKTVFKRPALTDVYLPATSCVFQKMGLCPGCSLYLATDAIVWKKPLEQWLVPLVLLLLFLLLAGRLWCGWVCPLGLLSDLMTRLREAVGISRVALSRRWRDGLVWTKYILLAVFLGVAVVAALPALSDWRLSFADPFCQVCPSRIFAAFFSFDQVCWTNFHDPVTTVFTWLGLVAFALFFVGLTVRRFWCRICPIGALSTVFNRTGLVMLRKDGAKCTRCRSCERCCPLDVRRVYEGRGQSAVTAFECHLCLRCVEACPEKDCLEFRWLGFRVTGSSPTLTLKRRGPA